MIIILRLSLLKFELLLSVSPGHFSVLCGVSIVAAQWSSDENITANIEFSHNRSITMLRTAGQANQHIILLLTSSHDLSGFSADCTRVICHLAPYNLKFLGRNTETF